MSDTVGNAAAVAKPKDFSYLSSPIIQVIVGVGELSKTFFVHKDLITSRSKFFEKALQNYGDKGGENMSWAEGQDGIVKLPEDIPDVFFDYVQILYHGELAPREKAKIITAIMTKEEVKKADMRNLGYYRNSLTKLYIFCDKVRDLQGKSTILTAYIQATNAKTVGGYLCAPFPNNVKAIYAGTMKGDALRKFCVDYYALHVTTEWYALKARKMEEFDHEFLFDVMREMAAIRQDTKLSTKTQSADEYTKILFESETDAGGASGAAQGQ